MNVDPERLAMLRANAALAIDEFRKLSSGTPFGYDKECVAWVEGLIERLRERKERVGDLVSVIGSYLGEAIIANAAGQWFESDTGELGLQLTNGDAAFSFAKVHKLFDNGLEGGDSMASLYGIAIKLLAIGKLREQAP